jgi:hypothetical protein
MYPKSISIYILQYNIIILIYSILSTSFSILQSFGFTSSLHFQSTSGIMTLKLYSTVNCQSQWQKFRKFQLWRKELLISHIYAIPITLYQPIFPKSKLFLSLFSQLFDWWWNWLLIYFQYNLNIIYKKNYYILALLAHCLLNHKLKLYKLDSYIILSIIENYSSFYNS